MESGQQKDDTKSMAASVKSRAKSQFSNYEDSKSAAKI